MQSKVAALGAALKSVNVLEGGAVGMYGTNSAEWMLAMKACDYCGAKCVPLYDTFGPEAVKFIIDHSGLTVIFCASDKLETLCEVLPKVSKQVVQVAVWTSGAGATAEEAVNSVSSHRLLACAGRRACHALHSSSTTAEFPSCPLPNCLSQTPQRLQSAVLFLALCDLVRAHVLSSTTSCAGRCRKLWSPSGHLQQDGVVRRDEPSGSYPW